MFLRKTAVVHSLTLMVPMAPECGAAAYAAGLADEAVTAGTSSWSRPVLLIRIPRLRWFGRKGAPASSDSLGLDAFLSESDQSTPDPMAASRR